MSTTLDTIPALWLVIGFAGQGMFFSRFLVQWVVSERRGRSIVPRAFWWLSVAGAGCLFVYALHRGDPVFLLGQGVGIVVYVRNLVLLARAASQRPAGQA